MLICYQRKILLASWWLILIWCERKILLTDWLTSQANRVNVLVGRLIWAIEANTTGIDFLASASNDHMGLTWPRILSMGQYPNTHELLGKNIILFHFILFYLQREREYRPFTALTVHRNLYSP